MEYSVLSRDWYGEYLEIIGSLPRKLNAVPEYSSPSDIQEENESAKEQFIAQKQIIEDYLAFYRRTTREKNWPQLTDHDSGKAL